jgi:hypothetical protein
MSNRKYFIEETYFLRRGYVILGNDHVVKFDGLQWIFITRPIIKDKDTIEGEHLYFSSLDQVFQEILNQRIGKQARRDMDKMLKAVKEAQKDIKKIATGMEQYCRDACAYLDEVMNKEDK